MKPLLGGKGANLAEMSRIGLPVPPGFTITTEVCTYYYDHKRTYPPRSRRRCRPASPSIEKQTGQEVRRREEPAARLGPLRRARLDAGHDGHDPQPRPQRQDRRGAGEEDRQRALRLGLLPPLRPDVRRRRAGRAEAAGRRPRAVRRGDRDAEARALSPGHRGHEADAPTTEGTGRRFKALVKERTGKDFPAVPWDQLDGRHRRRVRLLDERSRDRLSPQVQHPDRMGHGRQRAGDGLRQHRRRFGLGRRVHAQPGERREGVLRRVPDQRAGRRRRRRHAHAGAGRAAEEAAAEGVRTSSNASARRSRSTSRTCRTSSSRSRTASVYMLQTRNGKRTGHGRAQVRGRHGEGEADRLEDRRHAQPGRSARPAARAGLRLAEAEKAAGDRDGPAGRPRRGVRQDLSQRRSRGRRGRAGASRCCSSATRRRPKICAA